MPPHIVVVGDVMLDEYVYGDVTRISPEASTPILKVRETVRMLGGAGNVARNVAALGAVCDFVTVIDGDEAGTLVLRLLRDCGPSMIPWVITPSGYPRGTTRKTRFVGTHHMLRLDTEDDTPIGEITERAVVAALVKAIPESQGVILSDYCKGLLTRRVVAAVFDIAITHNKPIIVDSKRTQLTDFIGANYVKLNADASMDLAAVIKSARDTIQSYKIGGALVTRGENGMVLVTEADAFSLAGKQVRVRDVSGAGDTAVAAFTVAMAEGYHENACTQWANDAASIAVTKPGTAVVTRAELKAEDGKIVRYMEGNTTEAVHVLPGDDPAPLLTQRLAEWRGQTIGFTNGCFDLLHPGHLALLNKARTECDRLIVGLNSDASTRRLKGPARPVQSEMDRARVLAALDIVDLVVIFHDEAALALLTHTIKPDVLVKGSDWNHTDIAGSQHAKRVVLVERAEEGPSTTKLVERVRSATISNGRGEGIRRYP